MSRYVVFEHHSIGGVKYGVGDNVCGDVVDLFWTRAEAQREAALLNAHPEPPLMSEQDWDEGEEEQ